MNNEIRFYKKLTLLITAGFVIILTTVVLHYENDMSPKYIGKPGKIYIMEDIKQMITRLPDYQGDSVVIDEDGKLRSSDALIQSVIDQMYIVDTNINGIRKEAMLTDLPEPYLVYKTAIKYYIKEHGRKVPNKADTVATR